MAKLSDLSADLVQTIIDDIMLTWSKQQYNAGSRARHDEEHHKLDHNGLTPIDLKWPRAPIQRRKMVRRDQRNYISLGRDYQQTASSRRQVSWPEGLPDNPCLPLSLVSRTFRQCAQKKLFEHVVLDSPWQAHFFHRTLTGSAPVSEPTRADNASSKIEEPHRIKLAQHVRTLQFMWSGICSMDRGGGSLVCEILRSCPFLENLAISNALWRSCPEPVLEAMASRRLIKEFLILAKPCPDNWGPRWAADTMLARLFTQWDQLHTVELHKLAGRPVEMIEQSYGSIPVANCALRTVILVEPNLHENELAILLKNSRESLRTLEIIEPSERLDRRGLIQLLQEYTSPDLESLRLGLEGWSPYDAYLLMQGSGHGISDGEGSDAERSNTGSSDCDGFPDPEVSYGNGSADAEALYGDGWADTEGFYGDGSADAEGFYGDGSADAEGFDGDGPADAEGSDGDGSTDAERSDDDPSTNQALMDILFRSPNILRNLKSLSFSGEIASPKLFALLPQSLIKLAWQYCNHKPTALAKILSCPAESGNSLPNLKCCSARIRREWREEDWKVISGVLESRGGCHQDVNPFYGGQTESENDREESPNRWEWEADHAPPSEMDYKNLWD
ncbi:hypothetical protein PtA15_2A610 [Puccinia triticina]|uniref:F-box domain-containing protein n=1 Tax=Puccinia triticina TaxID=208348 RepID=A0ABY7CBL0_9BASI|nr:uncharacterized protein PtA15_2A610 [Puccinia triticina]WAQ82293.1 hypothetical protein PtA15_2A610 [Puccinia triticina]